MIEYLECPDLHFDMNQIEVMDDIFNTIENEAMERAVDFIAIPGDLYHRPVYASDQGGINKLREYIRRMTAICPVVAVYGTPSHEAPGSLEPLTDVGLTILEPGKVYGYNKYKKFIKEVVNFNDGLKGKHDFAYPIQEETSIDTILFGVPELSKKNIQAQLGLPAEQANAEAINQFRQYIAEFVAPMRAKNPDIPAVMIMHGNVSDSSRDNETDTIKKHSDIVIHAEDFRPANLDRISLGHIHTPWESKIICAGYAGSWGKTWGETGFKPGMNLVKIQDQVNISRVPYPTPERRKILKPLSTYDPDIAYWLCSDDPDATLPENVHSWSRVTYNEQRQETRRVSREEAEGVKSLRDLFKLADPEVTEPVLKKVDTIEEKITTEHHTSVDMELQSVEVKGCDGFAGETVRFDLAGLSPGITGIRGDNGEGKSFLLGFCPPYPVIVGKDTESGRPSAIKDFFSGQDSSIHKVFINHADGKTHTHHITIRAAHTQTPKVECYLDIDMAPQLDRGTFDEMFEKCEQLYGPYNDYLLTTFYVQPLQGKTKAGLMDATMIDIRDLVQSIAGIDRESEKRFALDKVADIQKEIERLQAWLSGAEEFQLDISEIDKNISDINNQIVEAEKEVSQIKSTGQSVRDKYDAAVKEQQQSEAEKQRKIKDETRAFEIGNTLHAQRDALAELKKLSAQLTQNEQALKTDNTATDHNRAVDTIIDENNKLKREYDQAVYDEMWRIQRENEKLQKAYQDEKTRLENSLNGYELSITLDKAKLESLNDPCPQCGYIAPDKQEQIEKLKASIEADTEKELEIKDQLADLVEPEMIPEKSTIPEPEYKPVSEVKPVMSGPERDELTAAIQKGREASAKITATEDRIKELETELKDLENQTYAIDENIENVVDELKKQVELWQQECQEKSNQIAGYRSELQSLEQQREKAVEVQDKITSAKTDIETNNSNLEGWQHIAKMLQPARIPALELELVLDAIDAEASKIIEPFQEQRYSIFTETQQQGKKGTVDRFDIKVHDNMSGEDKSFVKWNPGHKAFFADAYTKALIQQRNLRAKRTYNPVIMDEADGPIQPERIADYYEMQRQYWTDSKVLVVSHSPASHEHIESIITMEELKA